MILEVNNQPHTLRLLGNDFDLNLSYYAQKTLWKVNNPNYLEMSLVSLVNELDELLSNSKLAYCSLEYFPITESLEKSEGVEAFLLRVIEKMGDIEKESLKFSFISHKKLEDWNLWYQEGRGKVLRFTDHRRDKSNDVNIYIEYPPNRGNFISAKFINNISMLFLNAEWSKKIDVFTLLTHSLKEYEHDTIVNMSQAVKRFSPNLRVLNFYVFKDECKHFWIEPTLKNFEGYYTSLERLSFTFASILTYKNDSLELFNKYLLGFLGKRLKYLHIYFGSRFISGAGFIKFLQNIELFKNQLVSFNFLFWNNMLGDESIFFKFFDVLKNFGSQLNEFSAAILLTSLSDDQMKYIESFIQKHKFNLTLFHLYTQSKLLKGSKEFLQMLAKDLPYLLEASATQEQVTNWIDRKENHPFLTEINRLEDFGKRRKCLIFESMAIFKNLQKLTKRKLILIDIIEKLI